MNSNTAFWYYGGDAYMAGGVGCGYYFAVFCIDMRIMAVCVCVFDVSLLCLCVSLLS